MSRMTKSTANGLGGSPIALADRDRPRRFALHRAIGIASVIASLAVAATLSASPARAEDGYPDVMPAAPALAPLTAQQLDELVAPVALYPDPLLNSLLPATTAPEDIKVAAQFVAARGGAVAEAPDDVNWEPSVVALLQFPDVLKWM